MVEEEDEEEEEGELERPVERRNGLTVRSINIVLILVVKCVPYPS